MCGDTFDFIDVHCTNAGKKPFVHCGDSRWLNVNLKSIFKKHSTPFRSEGCEISSSSYFTRNLDCYTSDKCPNCGRKPARRAVAWEQPAQLAAASNHTQHLPAAPPLWSIRDVPEVTTLSGFCFSLLANIPLYFVIHSLLFPYLFLNFCSVSYRSSPTSFYKNLLKGMCPCQRQRENVRKPPPPGIAMLRSLLSRSPLRLLGHACTCNQCSSNHWV